MENGDLNLPHQQSNDSSYHMICLVAAGYVTYELRSHALQLLTGLVAVNAIANLETISAPEGTTSSYNFSSLAAGLLAASVLYLQLNEILAYVQVLPRIDRWPNHDFTYALIDIPVTAVILTFYSVNLAKTAYKLHRSPEWAERRMQTLPDSNLGILRTLPSFWLLTPSFLDPTGEGIVDRFDNGGYGSPDKNKEQFRLIAASITPKDLRKIITAKKPPADGSDVPVIPLEQIIEILTDKGALATFDTVIADFERGVEALKTQISGIDFIERATELYDKPETSDEAELVVLNEGCDDLFGDIQFFEMELSRLQKLSSAIKPPDSQPSIASATRGAYSRGVSALRTIQGSMGKLDTETLEQLDNQTVSDAISAISDTIESDLLEDTAFDVAFLKRAIGTDHRPWVEAFGLEYEDNESIYQIKVWLTKHGLHAKSQVEAAEKGGVRLYDQNHTPEQAVDQIRKYRRAIGDLNPTKELIKRLAKRLVMTDAMRQSESLPKQIMSVSVGYAYLGIMLYYHLQAWKASALLFSVGASVAIWEQYKYGEEVSTLSKGRGKMGPSLLKYLSLDKRLMRSPRDLVDLRERVSNHSVKGLAEQWLWDTAHHDGFMLHCYVFGGLPLPIPNFIPGLVEGRRLTHMLVETGKRVTTSLG